MSSSQPGDVIETLVSKVDTRDIDGDNLSLNFPIIEMSTGTTVIHGSPRERDHSVESHSAVQSPKSKKDASPRSLASRSVISKPSSIPVKMQKSSTSKIPSHSVSRTGKLSRPSSATLKSLSTVTNKHTLEIQFINKKKRLAILKKELTEKQKPVMDLYQNLIQIKKRLEELGKIVYLEEVKLMSYNEQADFTSESGDGKELFSPEVFHNMQRSIEEIPKTLMTICKNLLGRRNVIVELLESIVKSEVDVADLHDQIETLKTEGIQLQNNLDVVINEHAEKVKEIVRNWQKLLNEKTNIGTSAQVEELQEKLRLQERLTHESKALVQDLQRKLDDKRGGHDRYVTELNGVIHALRDQIGKLEQELESERKASQDYKNRNTANAQNSKHLRNKIADLESDKKATETANNELSKKLKQLQDQIKTKESQWTKEKEELTKNLKHQENLLQKLNADKSSFETRLVAVEGERTSLEQELQNTIDDLTVELSEIKTKLETVTKEKDEAMEKKREMEEHISKMGLVNKKAMDVVSNSIEWGKDAPTGVDEAQKYSQLMMKEIMLQELNDRIKLLEQENSMFKRTLALAETDKSECKSETEKTVLMQHEMVAKYKELLAESEQKLIEKSHEVSKLTSEIRQLKVRQEHLEELNEKCPTDNLQRMVEEGRNKLNELMKKSLESEQKLLHCENIIDKQSKQMNEMENLLRYRENMAGVLKASRDELILEKESLTRYSHEMRTVLAEMTKESKMKDRLIKELQEKIDMRERQMSKLEKENRELEQNLMLTNEKRFKLQETIGSMEKELQSTKAHVNQLADINTRYELGMKYANRNSFPKHRPLETSNLYPNAPNEFDQNYKSLRSSITAMSHTETPCQNNLSNTQDILARQNSQSSQHFEQSYQNNPFQQKYISPDCKQINSKSLLSLSLKQIDFLKHRLNYLTTLSPIKSAESLDVQDKSISNHSLQHRNLDSKNKLNRMVQLTAKRYEYLQKQAYESYEELTNLMKLALTSHKSNENVSKQL